MNYADIKMFSYIELRDGRVLFVTDVADQDPNAYPDNLPVETILVGRPAVITEYGKKIGTSTVVTDMSEVVSILE